MDAPTPTAQEPEQRPDTGEIHRPASDAFARTWELELIISGAVLYALVQLPGAIDGWYFGAEPHLAGATRSLAGAFYYYAKLACYTLGTAFIIHLAARAYWVGLLGLDTAFPNGVRWEKLGQTPIAIQVYRERQPPLERLVHRVDRFCSVIFSSAFVIVFLFVYSVITILVLGLLALPISAYFFEGERLGDIIEVLAFVLLAPVPIVALLDRLMQNRLDPSRGLGRIVYRVNSAVYSLSIGVTYIPVVNILLTNVRKTAVYGAFAALIAVVLGLFTVKDSWLSRGRLAISGYEYLPDSDLTATVDYRYYADLYRPGGRATDHPTIQSQAVGDPFVRLFLPYIPERHSEAIERGCRGVAALGGTGPRLLDRERRDPPAAQVSALLACLTALQPVRLNGQPIAPQYRFYTDPVTRRRGIVAFLSVSELPAGENRLSVGALPEADQLQPALPHEIPFWVEDRARP